MATLKLNSYELFTQSENNRPEFGTGVPAGCMLQVKSTTKTDHWGGSGISNGNSGVTPYAVTGLSVSITPKFSSSNILLFADIFMGMNNFEGYNYYWSFYRSINGSSYAPIGVGNDSNATQFMSGGHNMYPSGSSVPFAGGNSKNYLDSPSTTSEIIYQIYVGAADSNAILYVNRRGNTTTISGVSTITAMEIAA